MITTEQKVTNKELFLGKMYIYLGDSLPNGHKAYTDDNGVEYGAYPFELFLTSPMAKAASRAFDDLTLKSKDNNNIECQVCYDEEGSYSCVKFAHQFKLNRENPKA